MYLVQGVLGHLEHLHVGPELFDERLDDGLGRGRAGHPDALCGHFLARPKVLGLVVEPHDAGKLEVLQKRAMKKFKKRQKKTHELHLARIVRTENFVVTFISSSMLPFEPKDPQLKR